MRAVRIIGQAVIHAASRYDHFHHYTHTTCGIRVNWIGWEGNSPRGEPTDAPVDCVTCLVNIAREQDAKDRLTNPCAEI